jgi:hypothetical protein
LLAEVAIDLASKKETLRIAAENRRCPLNLTSLKRIWISQRYSIQAYRTKGFPTSRPGSAAPSPNRHLARCHTIDVTAVDIRVIGVALVMTRYAGSEIFPTTGLIDVERSPNTLYWAKVDAVAPIYFHGGRLHVGSEITVRAPDG